MSRPAMPPGKRKIQTHVTLSQEVRDMAAELMRAEGLSMSEMLEDTIRKRYARLRKENRVEEIPIRGQMTFDQFEKLFQ